MSQVKFTKSIYHLSNQKYELFPIFHLFSLRLLKSPSSSVRADKKPRSWLSNDIKTPELNRVKGSLASKVDLILIQSRKGISHFYTFKIFYILCIPSNVQPFVVKRKQGTLSSVRLNMS